MRETSLVPVLRGRVLVRPICDKYSWIRLATGLAFRNPKLNIVHHHTERIVDYSQAEKLLHNEFAKTGGKPYDISWATAYTKNSLVMLFS